MAFDPATQPRVPAPRKPPSLDGHLAAQAQLMRQQTRAIGDAGRRVSMPGFVVFAGMATIAGAPVSWSEAYGAVVESSGGVAVLAPPKTGFYSVDISFLVTGGTSGDLLGLNSGGPPYRSDQSGGGATQAVIESSGNAHVSAHYFGLLGPGGGLAVGYTGTPGAATIKARVIGHLVRAL